MSAPIYSIGHSDHAMDALLELLKAHGVEAVADVRSTPRSRRFPQFSQDILSAALRDAGLAYVAMGDALGGLTSSAMKREMRGTGYEAMATTASFRAGLARLIAGAQRFRIAMLCAEKKPLECHRALLVGRALHSGGVSVEHILADGSAKTHGSLETELLAGFGLGENDLFASPSQRLTLAYRAQEERIRAAAQLARAAAMQEN